MDKSSVAIDKDKVISTIDTAKYKFRIIARPYTSELAHVENNMVEVVLEIQRRFLWWKYWSRIKTYQGANINYVINIQVYNAKKYLNKLLYGEL